MGFFSREPAIEGDERQECLAYYEEEKKLRLLYERVEQLFDKTVGKYENELFQARKAGRDFMSSLEKIGEVTEHISQAATEIVKRKKEMGVAPSAASAMASAWEAAYLDYEALRNPSNIVAGSDIVKVEAKRERTKELFTKFAKSLRRAWKEEKEFLKRLKLSGDEGQSILNDASRATAADEWLQKLENEIAE
ncbi:hypothetical protein ES708_24079 [subsurface metagenome]